MITSEFHMCLTLRITIAEASDKFLSDTIILTSNIKALGLHKILLIG